MTDEVAANAAKTFRDFVSAGGDVEGIIVETDQSKAEEVRIVSVVVLTTEIPDPRCQICL